MNRPPENDVCSICHAHFTAPCQANCSHWFCGNCIMRVWSYGSNTSQPCKCPLCRRPISLLVPSEDTTQDRDDSTVLRDLETYNRRFGGQSSSLIQRMQDLPFLVLTTEVIAGDDGSTKNASTCHQSSCLHCNDSQCYLHNQSD
ncbi:hypothetical protein HA466_0294930 [Hirschfeldia incana]|nr:hypothetical protein HA466_0294930 [Hirschfeldia incana]KAJ0232024.1 hypothetical protein HA466_0294930 [Hirschfeldia incana]